MSTSESERDYEAMIATWPPVTCQPKDCTHPTFGAFVAVQRFDDSGRFIAEVRVTCVACRERFRFLGVPAGVRFDSPAASIEGLELRAPIEPEGETQLHQMASFQMPEIPRRH